MDQLTEIHRSLEILQFLSRFFERVVSRHHYHRSQFRPSVCLSGLGLSERIPMRTNFCDNEFPSGRILSERKKDKTSVIVCLAIYPQQMRSYA